VGFGRIVTSSWRLAPCHDAHGPTRRGELTARRGAETRGRADEIRQPEPDGEEDFVTAVLAQFGRHGELQLVNCGHPPPLRFRAGAAELLASAAPTTPLGLNPAPTVQRFTLAPPTGCCCTPTAWSRRGRPTGGSSS
jgi:hypothetical protein